MNEYLFLCSSSISTCVFIQRHKSVGWHTSSSWVSRYTQLDGPQLAQTIQTVVSRQKRLECMRYSYMSYREMQMHEVQRSLKYTRCSGIACGTKNARKLEVPGVEKLSFFFFLSGSRFWICTKFLVVWFENLGVLVTWCGTETHAVQTRFECIRYREGSNANAWDIEKAQIHEVQRYCMGALHSPDERIPSGVAEEEFGRMISGKIFPWGLQSSVDAFGSCSWRWGVALECAMTCVC